MSKLLEVAEGILDSAASEYLESNLASVDSVQAYAENACEIYLSDGEAEQILNACKAWVEGSELKHFKKKLNRVIYILPKY